MNKMLLAILLLLPLTAQAQISAPETVKVGEAIHFSFDDAKEGDVIRYDLLNPWPEPKLIEIRTKYGTDFIVDPPCNWKGDVRVQVIVVDKIGLVRFIGNKSVKVGEGTIVIPEPPPNPPKPEYNGPNSLGIGLVSFENAPEYDADVVNIYKNAANYLYGRPNLKFVYSQDSYKNSTDENVFVWIRGELSDKPGWNAHHNAVFKAASDKGILVGSPLTTWHAVLLEIAAGIEGRK